jgi:protein O-mannosyl-transferase
MTAPPRRWFGPAIFALGALLYLAALPNDWVLDDRLLVLNDPAVRDPGSWGAIVARSYWWFLSPTPGALHRPVTVASIALQHAIAGDAPWSYRLANALLHGLVAWLLFALLARRLEISPRAAALGAALYAAHPVLSEAVVQVVGRAEIFVALATLAILHLQLADWRLGGFGPRVLVPVALALLLLALGSKESAVAIPPILVAVDVARGRLRSQALVHAAAFALLFAWWFGVRAPVVAGIVALPPSVENPLHAMPLAERIPGAIGVLGRAAALVLAPIRLSADYSFDAIPSRPSLASPPVVAGAVGLAAAAAVLAWACARRRVAVAIGAATFALFLFPVSSLAVPIGAMFAERFLYVPLVGLAVLAAVALDRAPRLAPIAAVVVVLFAARTIVRERDWRDERTFYEATARGSRSAKAHWHLGLFRQRDGDFAEAEAEYRRALEILPDYDVARAHLARALRSQGRADEAKALYRRVIDAGLPLADPYVDLGEILEGEGRPADAVELFRRARGIDPRSANAWFGEGKALLDLRSPDALACFEEALRLNPRLAPAWAGKGDCLRASDPAAARAAYLEALRLEPNEPAYRARLDSLH